MSFALLALQLLTYSKVATLNILLLLVAAVALPAKDVVVVALADCLPAQHHFQWVQLLLWLALEELADWVTLLLSPAFVEAIVSFQHLQPSAAVAESCWTTVSRMEAQAVAVVVMTLLRGPVQQDKETQAAQAPLPLAAVAAVLVVLVLPELQIQAMAMVALVLLVQLQELALLMPEGAALAPLQALSLLLAQVVLAVVAMEAMQINLAKTEPMGWVVAVAVAVVPAMQRSAAQAAPALSL
jgi:hypothetical protein